MRCNDDREEDRALKHEFSHLWVRFGGRLLMAFAYAVLMLVLIGHYKLSFWHVSYTLSCGDSRAVRMHGARAGLHGVRAAAALRSLGSARLAATSLSGCMGTR